MHYQVRHTLETFPFARAVSAAVLGVLLGVSVIAADRKWQTGTLVDIGTKRQPWVGNPSSAPAPMRPVPPAGGQNGSNEVALYTIETDDRRIRLEDVQALGSEASVERILTVGGPVTFALEKTTAYVRASDGKEYRLRVVRNEPRAKK
jgi:hypothetical protein